MAHEFSLGVENIESHFILRCALKIIIDHCAHGWVVTGRLAFVDFFRVMQSHRRLRLVKQHVGRRALGGELAQGRQIIQDPEGAAMCGRDEIVILDYQIVNGRLRQVQLQWLPVRAIIEREIYTKLGPGVEQPFAFRILPHAVDVCALWDSIGDCAPARRRRL